MSGNRSKSAFFERGWVTLSADFRGKGASPTNCWCQKTRVVAVSIVRYQNICSPSFTFVTIHASDGPTDGQTELRQQYGVLHDMQSHGNKTLRELESQSFVVLYSLSRGPVLCGPVSSFAVLVLPHWNMGCH